MTPPVIPVPAPDSSAQVTELVQRIMNSANWRSELEKTVKKNVRLSALVRDQKTQLDRFAAKFDVTTGEPKEGKLLTKDEAAAYAAFVDLKLKPEDIKAMVTEHGKLKEKEDDRKKEEQFEIAAEALGYDNVAALTRWLTREKLVLDFKDQRVEELDDDGNKTGKKTLKRMPYVRPAEDEKAALEPLEDYIEREVPEFVAIFKEKPESDEEGEGDAAEGDTSDDFITRASREAEARVKGGRTGVRVPATQSARRDGGGSKDSRKLEDLEKAARSDQMYRV